MALPTYNIADHYRGDTWRGVHIGTIMKDNSPVNLSGCQLDMEFRKSVDSPVEMKLSTTDSSIILLDPIQGKFRIPPKRITMPYGDYVFDLQVIFPDGFVKTYMKGTWKITPDITS